MKKLALVLLVAGAVLAPPLTSAHPPSVDSHNSCVVKVLNVTTTSPLVPVLRTLSYLAPLGTSLPCPGATPWGPTVAEWGSHASACTGGEGAILGAYCGPVVPPGGFATCAWFPIADSVPTGLIIGFDGYLAPFPPPGKPGLPGMDGFVSFATAGELPVFGPFPASPTIGNPIGWTVPNPYPVPARVIAFPTDVGPYPPGALGTADVNLVQCD